MIPQEIAEALKAKFPDAIVEMKLEAVIDPWIKIQPNRIMEVCKYLRDDLQTDFNTLMCLSGVDHSGGKLGVTYHLNSTKLSHKIVLKVEVTVDTPHVQSIESIWKTANWHEREAYDMFGIIFDGHPDLRRILCPDDWIGHPLRKDYQVPEYYNGMKVPY
jgi:NADH-quinone oxidoreductase subunit C